MSPPRHHDEALRHALEASAAWISSIGFEGPYLVVDDLVGRIAVAIWAPLPAKKEIARLRTDLEGRLGAFWSSTIHEISGNPSTLWAPLWESASPRSDLASNLRVLERAHGHLHWFSPPPSAPPPRPESTRIVAFLSFKGGVGRTTALASFAIQRARAGERVAVVDLDLDAPGVGALLNDEGLRTQAPYGVVDFLLEEPWVSDLEIDDYAHECSRRSVTEVGSILVFPAGTLDDAYLGKLARVDLNSSLGPPSDRRGIAKLLEKITSHAQSPAWVLIDGRAGLSETAGLLLSGLADLHVLVATASEQSYAGLTRMIDHVGARRLRASTTAVQADVVVVQSMVPDNTVVAREVEERFAARLEEIFSQHYYAKDQDAEEDRWWSVADLDNPAAPHRPVVLGYKGRLAAFDRIDDVADDLATDPTYRALGARILDTVGRPSSVGVLDDDATDE